jgi:dihydroorotate dehydrogenase (NAD+) catalytic subunit
MANYDIGASYEWNYANAPAEPERLFAPDWPGTWDFCGLPVSAPIGIAAGPLLNSRWLLYYAARGFDVVTYKTVRSSARASYSPPNLLPVRGEAMAGAESAVIADAGAGAADSWAISFGMPCRDPVVWQEDAARARRELGPRQVLVVSVVASPEDGWSLNRIAADFAQCARWARDAGAHVVEANLSCPNVETQEGNLYASDTASGRIAEAIRREVPEVPLVLKVGLFDDRSQMGRFVRAVSGTATAISTTNTIAAMVQSPDGSSLFAGGRRGIGGRMIAARCLQELRMLADAIGSSGSDLRLIGVGGVSTADDVLERLQAGAHHVQLATAAMLDPDVGVTLRRECALRCV